ncbi:MAG: hypothetical protein ACKO6E_08065, partial [Planctomycetota bacterium]
QSLLEQLLGSATGPIGVDEVHALIGTCREERIGELVAAIAAREPARALAALDASLQGGADPGGVLDQLIAALRESLLASVGCAPESLALAQGLGVDLAALGGRLGTATLLAMLQILDQALARMRTSGHAALLAEMAVIRLATLEDLESLAAAIDRVASAAPPAAAGGPSGQPAVRPPPAAAAPRPSNPPAQKKTAELTAAPADREAGADERAAVAAVAPAAAPRAAADARAAWRQAAEGLGGLAGDFAAEAVAAVWQQDRLEVEMPAASTAAVAFLRRPEVVAAVNRALAEIAGRPVGHVLVVAASAPAAPGADEPVRPPTSQVALVREVSEHPLVAHARTLFDASIRRVDPPRPRDHRSAAQPGALAVEAAPATADGDEQTVTEAHDG